MTLMFSNKIERATWRNCMLASRALRSPMKRIVVGSLPDRKARRREPKMCRRMMTRTSLGMASELRKVWEPVLISNEIGHCESSGVYSLLATSSFLRVCSPPTSSVLSPFSVCPFAVVLPLQSTDHSLWVSTFTPLETTGVFPKDSMLRPVSA